MYTYVYYETCIQLYTYALLFYNITHSYKYKHQTLTKTIQVRRTWSFNIEIKEQVYAANYKTEEKTKNDLPNLIYDNTSAGTSSVTLTKIFHWLYSFAL